MTSVVVYGIRNCDTVRKSLRWLQEQHIAHHFHDLRQDGLAPTLLDQWLASLGWQPLLNQRSTTWRGLGLSTETLDAAAIRQLLLEHVALLKRPLLCIDGHLQPPGFDPAQWAAALQA